MPPIMYYKIIRGYSAEDYIEIDEKELEKAYYCFLTKKDGVFSGGAVRGSQMLAIQPDYHKTMGWNRGYKLEVNDYAQLKESGTDRKFQKMLGTTKERVQYLIETKQDNLIGQNAKLPELDAPKEQLFKEITKNISNKFKIV